ncbi:protein ELC-like [Ananas comosus]|uniref:Protein ELC-like n=1 Tax=Ananas comosus TaxID=4615 RepID=A0A199W4Z4_ANACO|nr:protein ELC-like [Ananas comosus]OAY84248.1 Protein ELC-like [Ananas comosus]
MAPSPEMAAVADQLVDAARMQFGPSPLPYADAARWMIRHHLLSLSDIFPAFRAALSPFVHNDGRSAVLLHVHGPIPTYIPISVWLVEAYPYVPPLVYLSPPSGTAVADKHPFVDPSGTVFSHYNLSWTFPSSNLVDLVRDLSVLFAVHPPLVASYDLKDDVVAKILRDLDAGKADTERLLTTQTEMRRRHEVLECLIKQMIGEVEEAEEQLQTAATNVDVMESWVRESRRKNDVLNGEVDADDVFGACDEPSQRLMESTAADMAAEDAMYALDCALRERRVPVDGYLRSVRELAREQFFFRFASRRVCEAREVERPGVGSARPAVVAK